ncbi:phosphate acetyltransferase [Erysipelotrichaceae bacterium 3_1_53]|nr:phosphate acetyltransferase [Erysipelotrichaceae bacterium 3_1_53]
MINSLIEKIKGKGTRIVFTEGSDPRILEAAIRLHKEDIVVPVLLGNRAEIAGAAAANGWDIEGIETLDPIEYKNMDMMVTKVIELRKGKLDEAQAREACLHRNFLVPCMLSWAVQMVCLVVLHTLLQIQYVLLYS